jgi:hypothetical protein
VIPISGGVRLWLATRHTDMPRGFDGLPLLVQEARTSASASRYHSAAVRAAISGS